MPAPADDGCLGPAHRPTVDAGFAHPLVRNTTCDFTGRSMAGRCSDTFWGGLPLCGDASRYKDSRPPVIWIAIIEVRHQPEPGHYDDGGDGLLLNPGGGTTPKLSITYLTIDTVMISPKAGARS
jgi:hypothetical protein